MRLADHPSHQILARQLFDGLSDEPLQDRIVEIANGLVTDIRCHSSKDGVPPEYDIVTPGFIDLQINGAADAQFNFDPSVQTLERIAAGARQGGTAHILPTFITAPGDDYMLAIKAVQAARQQNVPGILGLHLEGPFLSPKRPGIHDAAAIRALTERDLTQLLDANVGTLLLTLAPEELPDTALKRLSQADIRVFAGHTEATADQIALAEADQLTGVTHLFNAMSQMTGREPGVVGAALASPSLFAGIIADGHHVDWRNIATAARLMPDRLCLVTDAMLTLAGTCTQFNLDGKAIRLENGRLTDNHGRLAGAHISLIECLRNVLNHTDISMAQALKMLSANPARALGLSDDLGSLRPGSRASLTCLTQDLEVASVIVNGNQYEAAAG